MKKKILSAILFILIGPLGIFFFKSLPFKFVLTKKHFFYPMFYQIQNFAFEHNKLLFPDKYKMEIEEFMLIQVPVAEANMDKIIEETKEYCENFVNDSNDKFLVEYIRKMNDFERALESEKNSIYLYLYDITDKYSLIHDDNLLLKLESYFDKYGVNTLNLKHLDDYLKQKKCILNEYRKAVSPMIIKKETYQNYDKEYIKKQNKAILWWAKYKGKKIVYC